VYLHRPVPKEMEAAAVAWGWDARAQGVSTFQLVQRAGGDLRVLRGMVDRGGEWFRAGREANADQPSDPFVLVPTLWAGIAGELEPVDLRGPRRGALASAFAEVVHDGADIFFENYHRVLQSDQRFDRMAMMADMLSTADMLSVWREGDGEAGDDDYMAGQFGAELIVAGCATLQGKWRPIKLGCRAPARYAQAKMLEHNTEVLCAQRVELRLSARSASTPVTSTKDETIGEFMDRSAESRALKQQEGLAQLTATQVLDWPVCLQRV